MENLIAATSWAPVIVGTIIGVIIFGGWVVRDAKKYKVDAVTPINARVVLFLGMVTSDIITFGLGVEGLLFRLIGMWSTAIIELSIDWLFLTIAGMLIWKIPFIQSFKVFMIFTLGWAVLFLITFYFIHSNTIEVLKNIPINNNP